MKLRTFLQMIPFLIFLWGCSAVKFSTSSNCGSDSNCVSQQNIVSYDLKEVIKGGKVDVLIVNDNSASMSFEQSRLAQRFSQFVAQFDQRYIDYRIGITTTDISSSQNPARSINLNGALQDGKLISFSDGNYFLTPESGSLSQKETMFNKAIIRNETLSCEKFLSDWISAGKSQESPEFSKAYYTNCPSSDERGIYAANLLIQNNYNSFLRPEADLAIIFLADEDVRSQWYKHNQPGYELADLDKHNILISKIKEKYPQKSFGLHAIIVKDPNCLSEQNRQIGGAVSGSYGWEYHYAAQAGNGVSGDICATDYTQQLLSIFDNIQGKVTDKISLACQAPQLQMENITLSTSDSSITSSVVGAEIRFNKKLPVGTTVSYKYKCNPNIK